MDTQTTHSKEVPLNLSIPTDEKELRVIEGLISGDREAFLRIFDQYHHALYVHVLHFVKSPDLAADLVQDVFIKIWENRAGIKVELSFKAYLFRIAKNHLINYLKRAAKEKSIKSEIGKYAISSHNQNEDGVIYADLAFHAERAIDQLPTQRQVVFRLFKEEGKDQHEIAAQLGISKNTVRDHLAKAGKFIRAYLRVKADISFAAFLVSLFSRFL